MIANALPSPSRSRRWILIVVAILIALSVGLALDLANRGVVWQVFWSLTGEESPVGQIRGMVDWTGKWIRPQPVTEPLAVISHTGHNPYGVNTFLEQEVEPEKRARQLEMIRDAGFTWIRQEFPWQDIEIAGRGDFVDRRNDVTGDGQIDAIDAWEKYDNIVDLAEEYGVQIQARLGNPPTWSQANDQMGDFAPSADVQDYVNYATAVAERYQGRIHYYQVWNEPNIYPEWGEQAVDPEAYTDLLCRTYAALKAVDPAIAVISGAMAPTVALSGRDLNDFIYLERMYAAGAGECFDILSMQGYGLYSGPTDTRMRPTTVNFSRNLYIRDLMVANGDADKAIWISEAAWSPVDEPGVPRDLIGFGNYGRVTLEQAARYMPIAYDRAQREWPWVGVINYWFFKKASDAEQTQTSYYFRMVEPDFLPLPIYDSVREYIANSNERPTLYQGVHQADDWRIEYADGVELIDDESAELGQYAETDDLTFTATGTRISVRWRDPVGVPALDRDGGPVETRRANVPPDTSGEWTTVELASSVLPETHTYRLRVNDGNLSIDSIRVEDVSGTYFVGFLAFVVFDLIVLVSVLVHIRRRRSA